MIEGFSMLFRFGRNRFGGRVLVYVLDDSLSKQVTKQKFLDDVGFAFSEVNVRKSKWLTFGTYRPPSRPVEYFFKHGGCALDTYRQIYEKFFLLVISTQKRHSLSEFLISQLFSLVLDKTYVKNPKNPRCIDLCIKNNTGSFHK